MTRIAAFVIVACGLAYSAPRPEASTYVDGNITALKPHTGGTLVFQDKDSMVFKTGGANVSVPYTAIHKAELGATQTHTPETKAYKVWDLPKRMHKNETQLLTLEFKNKTGEDNVMTLELPKPAAANVLAEIQVRTAKHSAKVSNDWWGDSWWKTQRNEPKWDNERASAHE